MTERWRIQGSTAWEAPKELLAVAGARTAGDLYLESDRGRIILWVSNGTRAMLCLLAAVGDSGSHAIDPEGGGSSGGFLLDNGQVDEYENHDTVPRSVGLEVLAALLTSGDWPAGQPWARD